MRHYVMDARKLPLNNIPLLERISAESLKKIDRHAKRVSYTKGQEIIARSEELNDVYILVTGLARVPGVLGAWQGGRIPADQSRRPVRGILGDRRGSAVRVGRGGDELRRAVHVVEFLPRTDGERSVFMGAVLNHLVGLLRSLTARIVEFSTLAVKNRIHSELLRMARDTRDGNGAFLISPAPTHSEIAQRISTHREAVSREISRLKQLGIIERRGRVLAVKDFERLERMVHEASGE